MGTEAFQGVKRPGRGFDHRRAIPLLHLMAFVILRWTSLSTFTFTVC